MNAPQASYRAVYEAGRGWLVHSPEGAVYPLVFGDRERLARDTATALNLARQVSLMEFRDSPAGL